VCTTYIYDIYITKKIGGEKLTFHAHSDAGGMGSSLFSDSVYRYSLHMCDMTHSYV